MSIDIRVNLYKISKFGRKIENLIFILFKSNFFEGKKNISYQKKNQVNKCFHIYEIRDFLPQIFESKMNLLSVRGITLKQNDCYTSIPFRQ